MSVRNFAVIACFAATVLPLSHAQTGSNGQVKSIAVRPASDTPSMAFESSSMAFESSSMAFESSSMAFESSSMAFESSSMAFESSSNRSTSVADVPDAPATGEFGFTAKDGPGHMAGRIRMAPFSAIGIAVKGGLAGAGVDIATPLGYKFNLRGEGSFFTYKQTFSTDGLPIDASLKFRTAGVSVDYYPFGNAFRISPGVTVYNGNQVNATVNIPVGGSFTINDTDYTSGDGQGGNPVTGSAALSFGNKVAPRLTFGTGNMIPRHGGHWSTPFEIGAEYLGKSPEISFNLKGDACQAGQGCGAINTGDNLANIQAQETTINHDISPLRFYPLVSIGVSYSFALHRK